MLRGSRVQISCFLGERVNFNHMLRNQNIPGKLSQYHSADALAPYVARSSADMILPFFPIENISKTFFFSVTRLCKI